MRTHSPGVRAWNFARVGRCYDHLLFTLVQNASKIDILVVEGQIREVYFRHYTDMIPLRVVRISDLCGGGGNHHAHTRKGEFSSVKVQHFPKQGRKKVQQIRPSANTLHTANYTPSAAFTTSTKKVLPKFAASHGEKVDPLDSLGQK